MIGKPLADILVAHKIFTADEILNYQQDAEQAGQSFEEFLLLNDLVSEQQMTQAIAEQFRLEYLEKISEDMAHPELLAKVPLKFLRQHTIIPIMHKGSLGLVTSHPEDFQPIDELSLLFDERPVIVVSSRSVINDAINRYYPLEGTKEMIQELEEEAAPDIDLEAIAEDDILTAASEAPIIKLVNHILYQAVKRGASDIHIEPFEKEVHVRYRIDGVLHDIFMPPKRAQSALISRLKIMANLNIAEKRIPQDGRINIKVADRPIDIRVSILPVSFGERVVMRLLDKTRSFTPLEGLGFSERDYKVIVNSIQQPNGIILVTGPTGSGKTSTLYSVLYRLNTPEVNIITVEDPVEYQMAGIGQVQVKEAIGLTFAAALRSILRQDPDIVMIGETRDRETAQIAIQAALTGHLVLSTLHTNSAAASITRLIDMGVEPFLIASTLVSALAQRLVRRLCTQCKKAYTPTADVLARLGIHDGAEDMTFYEPGGCDECLSTGYKGRLALFEIMVMTPSIARLTTERVDTLVLQEQARKDGMTMLIDDGVRKIKQGLTSVSEVLAVATTTEIIS